MDFTVGLSATKTGFELIKGIRDLLKRDQVDPHEISNRLMELQELMLEAQGSLGEAQDENRKLRHEIEELRRVADFGKEFQFDEGVYWCREYPYCPNCWDADKKPIRLDGPYHAASPEESVWSCPVHRSKYYLKKRRPWA